MTQGDELWQSANARVRAFVLQLLERDPEKRITAAAALQHPWVTADMLVPRPLSVRDNPAGIAAERRLRLSAARRQSTVEEMLRYMILVRAPVACGECALISCIVAPGACR